MKQTRNSFGYGVLAVLLILPFLASPAAAFEAKVSGQVNQMLMWADDGNEDDFFINDNTSSSTRFRITGAQDMGKVKAGFQIEVEAQMNRGYDLEIGQNSDGNFRFRERWLNAYFDTAFGKLEIGQGSGAADGTSETDLSGTALINYSSVADNAGSFVWRAKDGSVYFPKSTSTTTTGYDTELVFNEDTGELEDVILVPITRTTDGPGLTIGDTRSNFDGLGRNMRFRYNTPSFAGASLSASITNGEAWEVAARYAGDFAGNKIAAAVGYVDGRKRSSYKQWGASASWLMPFGVSITGAYGVRDYDTVARGRGDSTNWYGKLGYKFDIHAVSVEYGMTYDLYADGMDSSNYGLAYVIAPWQGVEFYASYRHFMLDVKNEVNPDDIKQAMLGTRIRF